MLVERCKAFPSEFSTKLLSQLETRFKNLDKQDLLHKLITLSKSSALSLALSIPIFRKTLRKIRNTVQVSQKHFVMTDINVPTDFANFCINND